jgi:hypothetical protein
MKKFLFVLILMVFISGCIQEKQTVFTSTSEAGGEGIARLRYDQNLTIELLPEGEYDFVVRYTVKTDEDLKNESAGIFLDPEGLAAFDVPPTEGSWEGDLAPGESLTLSIAVIVTKDNGKFLVRGLVGFGAVQTPEGTYKHEQTEHTDLYVVVENGKVVDVQKPKRTTISPEEAVQTEEVPIS